ncbi:hypothetical protein ACEW7V_03525 [Areca yellow leaf disease phytoplasma]|uniref:hypothetical protein n=1 Tax=Areca yellow leaf disease phytoplasma TaxID=927614 RepID=UPI0035B517F6
MFSSFVNNVREMEGALLRLLNYAQTFGYDIDINIANEALELLIKAKKVFLMMRMFWKN